MVDIYVLYNFDKLKNILIVVLLFYSLIATLLNHFLQTNVEARIWPHHFDTGIYAMPNEDIGLGFGLAMNDGLVGEPYFYLAAYKSEGAIDFISKRSNFRALQIRFGNKYRYFSNHLIIVR